MREKLHPTHCCEISFGAGVRGRHACEEMRKGFCWCLRCKREWVDVSKGV